MIRDDAPGRVQAMLAALRTFVRTRKPAQASPMDEADAVRLAQRFIAERLRTWQSTDEALADEAVMFVTMVKRCAEGLADLDAATPPDHKQRRRALESLTAALQRVQEVLVTIDSGALLWALHEADREANGGQARYTANPADAFIGAAAVREAAEMIMSALVLGTTRAASTLPKNEHSPILAAALQIERIFFEHGIPFDTGDMGFAADCLRVVCRMAHGKELDRPRYWLAKAVKHPDSMASLLARKTPA